MNRNDQEFIVQKIRTQYTDKENTKLDSLKELDKKVKRPANVFAYVYRSFFKKRIGLKGSSQYKGRLFRSFSTQYSSTAGLNPQEQFQPNILRTTTGYLCNPMQFLFFPVTGSFLEPNPIYTLPY